MKGHNSIRQSDTTLWVHSVEKKFTLADLHLKVEFMPEYSSYNFIDVFGLNTEHKNFILEIKFYIEYMLT